MSTSGEFARRLAALGVELDAADMGMARWIVEYVDTPSQVWILGLVERAVEAHKTKETP